jgi:hypothetical protein
VKKLVAVIMMVLLAGSATGCGSKAVAVVEYDKFSAMIQKGDVSGAWAMLSQSSQATFGSQSEFEKAVNEIKDTAFGPYSKLRNPGFEARDKNQPFGEIFVYDEKGNKTGEAGKFTLTRENNSWRVLWTLPRSTRDTSDIPGGSPAE